MWKESIWGAWERGKILCDYLKGKRIEATGFIDTKIEGDIPFKTPI